MPVPAGSCNSGDGHGRADDAVFDPCLDVGHSDRIVQSVLQVVRPAELQRYEDQLLRVARSNSLTGLDVQPFQWHTTDVR